MPMICLQTMCTTLVLTTFLTSNLLQHCDTCLDFNDNIQKHQFNPDKRMIYEEAKRKHYDDVMSER
mgnify:CR=1 FL=1|jgi:hypothetical protein